MGIDTTCSPKNITEFLHTYKNDLQLEEFSRAMEKHISEGFYIVRVLATKSVQANTGVSEDVHTTEGIQAFLWSDENGVKYCILDTEGGSSVDILTTATTRLEACSFYKAADETTQVSYIDRLVDVINTYSQRLMALALSLSHVSIWVMVTLAEQEHKLQTMKEALSRIQNESTGTLCLVRNRCLKGDMVSQNKFFSTWQKSLQGKHFSRVELVPVPFNQALNNQSGGTTTDAAEAHVESDSSSSEFRDSLFQIKRIVLDGHSREDRDNLQRTYTHLSERVEEQKQRIASEADETARCQLEKENDLDVSEKKKIKSRLDYSLKQTSTLIGQLASAINTRTIVNLAATTQMIDEEFYNEEIQKFFAEENKQTVAKGRLRVAHSAGAPCCCLYGRAKRTFFPSGCRVECQLSSM
ncbi:hypothetical protein HDU78_010936 [Chytriomyces hyalinus]|nr:hypothetical protein HDU78_010936 [Chytriomyces hyalinus]